MLSSSSSTDLEPTRNIKEINLRRKNRRSIKLKEAFNSLSSSSDNKKESKKSNRYSSKYDTSSEDTSFDSTSKNENKTGKIRRKKTRQYIMPVWSIHDTNESRSSSTNEPMNDREIEKKSEQINLKQKDAQQFKMIQSPLIKKQKAHSTFINDNDQLSLHISDEFSAILENSTLVSRRPLSRTSKVTQDTQTYVPENVKELKVVIPEHEQIDMSSKRLKLLPDQTNELHTPKLLKISKDIKLTKSTLPKFVEYSQTPQKENSVITKITPVSDAILLNPSSGRKSDRLLRKRLSNQQIDAIGIPKDLSKKSINSTPVKHISNHQVVENVMTKSNELLRKSSLNKNSTFKNSSDKPVDEISPTSTKNSYQSSLQSSSIRKSDRLLKKRSLSQQIDKTAGEDLTKKSRSSPTRIVTNENQILEKESDRPSTQFDSDNAKRFRNSSRLSNIKGDENLTKSYRNNRTKQSTNLSGTPLMNENSISKNDSRNRLSQQVDDKITQKFAHEDLTKESRTSPTRIVTDENRFLEKESDRLMTKITSDSDSAKSFQSSPRLSNIKGDENLTKSYRNNRTKESTNLSGTSLMNENSVLTNDSRHTLSQQVDKMTSREDLTKKSRSSPTRTEANENRVLEKESDRPSTEFDSDNAKSFRNSSRFSNVKGDGNLTKSYRSNRTKESTNLSGTSLINKNSILSNDSRNRLSQQVDQMTSHEDLTKQSRSSPTRIEANENRFLEKESDRPSTQFDSDNAKSFRNSSRLSNIRGDENLTKSYRNNRTKESTNLLGTPLMNENSISKNDSRNRLSQQVDDRITAREDLTKESRSSLTRIVTNENRFLEKESDRPIPQITIDSDNIQNLPNSSRLSRSIKRDGNLTQLSSSTSNSKTGSNRVIIYKSANLSDDFEEEPSVEEQPPNSRHEIEFNKVLPRDQKVHSVADIIENLTKDLSANSDDSRKSYQSQNNSSITSFKSFQDKRISAKEPLMERDKQSRTLQTAHHKSVTSAISENEDFELLDESQEVRIEEQLKSPNEKTKSTEKVLKQTEIGKYLENLKMKMAIENEEFQQKIEKIKNVPVDELPREITRKNPPKKRIKPNSQAESLKKLTTIDGKRYRKPREFKKPAYWVTERLQSAFVKELSKRYEGSELIDRVNDLILQLVTTVKTAYKRKKYPEDLVESLKTELAMEQFIETNFDFFNFINEYVPRLFWSKIIPQLVPGTSKTTVPYNRLTVFSKILE